MTKRFLVGRIIKKLLQSKKLLTKSISKELLVSQSKKTVDEIISDKHIFYANIVVAFTLFGAIDIIEQCYEILKKQRKNYDLKQSRNQALSGGITGAITHFWYIFLETKYPGVQLRVVIKKVFLDQLLCSPVRIVNEIAVVDFLDGKSKEEMVQDIKNDAFSCYITEWVIWVPIQFINLFFLSPKWTNFLQRIKRILK